MFKVTISLFNFLKLTLILWCSSIGHYYSIIWKMQVYFFKVVLILSPQSSCNPACFLLRMEKTAMMNNTIIMEDLKSAPKDASIWIT